MGKRKAEVTPLRLRRDLGKVLTARVFGQLIALPPNDSICSVNTLIRSWVNRLMGKPVECSMQDSFANSLAVSEWRTVGCATKHTSDESSVRLRLLKRKDRPVLEVDQPLDPNNWR
jgi:hypothetical protein